MQTSSYFIPFAGAIIGWLLCRIFLNIILGRITNKRTEIAARIIQAIPKEMSSLDFLQDKITDPARLAAVKPLIEQHVNTFLNIKLQEKLPVIAMFASPDMLAKIKEGLLEEIDLLLPEVIAKYTGNLAADIDLQKIILPNIEALSAESTRLMLQQGFRKELQLASQVGALLGFLIGTILLIITLI